MPSPTIAVIQQYVFKQDTDSQEEEEDLFAQGHLKVGESECRVMYLQRYHQICWIQSWVLNTAWLLCQTQRTGNLCGGLKITLSQTCYTSFPPQEDFLSRTIKIYQHWQASPEARNQDNRALTHYTCTIWTKPHSWTWSTAGGSAVDGVKAWSLDLGRWEGQLERWQGPAECRP